MAARRYCGPELVTQWCYHSEQPITGRFSQGLTFERNCPTKKKVFFFWACNTIRVGGVLRLLRIIPKGGVTKMSGQGTGALSLGNLNLARKDPWTYWVQLGLLRDLLWVIAQ